MVESNKPDLILDEILNEHSFETKSRMKQVSSFIGADYREYLENYIKNTADCKKLCIELAEPGAIFAIPEDIEEVLFGEGNRKENIYMFRNMIENPDKVKQCSQCFKKRTQMKCERDCRDKYTLLAMSSKWPKYR